MTPLQETLLAHAPVAALLTLALFAGLFAFYNRATRRRPFALRTIAAYERLRTLATEGVETGQTVHVSLGAGAWEQSTPDLVAGLTALDYVSQVAAGAEQAACATTGSPVALLLAMNLLQANDARLGRPGGVARHELCLYGPEPLAYAGGAAAEGRRAVRAAHLLLGRFGDEGLWLAEALQPGRAPVLGGTGEPAAVALMQLTTEHAVIGEDLFAAGAYLHRSQHLGSLAAQDAMRLLLAIALVAGAILASLGIGG